MSWTNEPLVRVGHRADNAERGVFARAPIAAGAVLGVFDGRAQVFAVDAQGRVDWAEWGDGRMVMQLGHTPDGRLLGLVPIAADDVRGIDLINHSCTPSCVVDANGLVVRAARALAEGVELTIDYRGLDPVPLGTACWCNKPESERCRI